MTKLNVNADALCRELRKLKTVKTVDFKGLLAGTPESYVKFYRSLLIDDNITVYRYLVDKGFDLTGLTDYKFMESLYKLMRDILEMRPCINQNQFFSSGFVQRKLELSAQLVSHVRQILRDLDTKSGKKTVQTPGLMRSSQHSTQRTKPRQRVRELGDEADGDSSSGVYQTNDDDPSDAITPTTNGAPRIHQQHQKRRSGSGGAHRKGASDRRRVGGGSNNGNEGASVSSTDRSGMELHSGSNTTAWETGAVRPQDSEMSRPRHFSGLADHYANLPGRHGDSTVGMVSAYEEEVRDVHSNEEDFEDMDERQLVRERDHHHHEQQQRVSSYNMRNYQPPPPQNHVRQMPPSALVSTVSTGLPPASLDRIAQQFETIISRMSMLESRMHRIETKLDAATTKSSEPRHTAMAYSATLRPSNPLVSETATTPLISYQTSAGYEPYRSKFPMDSTAKYGVNANSSIDKNASKFSVDVSRSDQDYSNYNEKYSHYGSNKYSSGRSIPASDRYDNLVSKTNGTVAPNSESKNRDETIDDFERVRPPGARTRGEPISGRTIADSSRPASAVVAPRPLTKYSSPLNGQAADSGASTTDPDSLRSQSQRISTMYPRV